MFGPCWKTRDARERILLQGNLDAGGRSFDTFGLDQQDDSVTLREQASALDEGPALYLLIFIDTVPLLSNTYRVCNTTTVFLSL